SLEKNMIQIFISVNFYGMILDQVGHKKKMINLISTPFLIILIMIKILNDIPKVYGYVLLINLCLWIKRKIKMNNKTANLGMKLFLNKSCKKNYKEIVGVNFYGMVLYQVGHKKNMINLISMPFLIILSSKKHGIFVENFEIRPRHLISYIYNVYFMHCLPILMH
ncbi:hypothetical protein ACJX0J_027579, partial [Zea mays]